MKHTGSFYPGCAENIENLQDHDKVLRYWLDKTSNKLSYKLLFGRRKVLNLVTNNPNELDSLRLRTTLDTKDGAQITIPQEFDELIEDCIKQQRLYLVEKE